MAYGENRRIILIVLVALLLLCLVGVLAFNVFFNNATITGGGQPTAPSAPTEEVAVAPPETTEEEATPTPTRVISEEEAGAEEEAGTEEEGTETTDATPEVAQVPTETPTPFPTATTAAASGSTGGDFSVSTSDQEPVMVDVIQIDELLENGSFEEGFDSTGVGEGWTSFNNGGGAINFSPETAEVYVKDGEYAQRISIDNVQEPDRYAGVYQTVEVIPGETYTLTVQGQIRSPLGNIQASSYGYRVQYAIDDEGGTDWRRIPQEDWVEMPWEENLIGTGMITFSKYMAPITATSDEMTIFVRTWNKWTAPGLTEYTLDSLSLIGPARTQQMVTQTAAAPSAGASGSGQMIDQPLPVTGFSDVNLMGDGRFWGGVIVLALLAIGAVYRAKWRW
jgi:hypothetical protein